MTSFKKGRTFRCDNIVAQQLHQQTREKLTTELETPQLSSAVCGPAHLLGLGRLW